MTRINDQDSALRAAAANMLDDNAPEQTGASLDKVRDILFGREMREYDRRLARLEERLVKETTELKEEVRKRLDALDGYVRRESETLSERMQTEREERLDSAMNLSRELRDAIVSTERRAGHIDEQLARSQREMRQQILDQHQRLTDDIRQRVDDVMALLNREAEELRSEKADRTTIASLFTEMAMRLRNELRIPGPGSEGNG